MLTAILYLAAVSVLQSQPADGNAGLFEAIQRGDAAQVRKLLTAGPDANARSRTYPALVWALFTNKPETAAMIAALLKAGADASAAGSDTKAAAQVAAEQQKLEILDAFLDNGLSPDWRNRNQESLLGVAAATGNVPIIRRLLERGAKVDVQDDEGFTPLMNACQNRHVEIVRLLVEKGADKTLKSKYGDTALSLVSGKYYDTQAGKIRSEIAALLQK